jgi:hypothetical protein
MDQRNKCCSSSSSSSHNITPKLQPEKYLYLPGGEYCDWIVYDQGEVAFVTIGKAWYQRRQDQQGNTYFVSIGQAANPFIVLTIPDLDVGLGLGSLEVATFLYKKPVYDYKDMLVELLGLHPSEYKYLSTKHSSFPELRPYHDDNNIDWIVFQGTSPTFLLQGDLMTGYQWYQRIHPTATFQCIDPHISNHHDIKSNATTAATTTTTNSSRMVDMSYNHLRRISHHCAMDYNTFCTIEKFNSRCQQKEYIAQLEKVKSEKLELTMMLAHMYATSGSCFMPRVVSPKTTTPTTATPIATTKSK